MKLLHLSDPHFGLDSYFVQPHIVKRELIRFIQDQMAGLPSEFYLMITGDIVFKGNNTSFDMAKAFFTDIITQTNILRENILVCPGNHDICNCSLNDFSIFSYSMRRDNKFSFEKNTSEIFFKGDICFLGINTVYSLEYKYGKVDLASLDDVLTQHKDTINQSKMRVVFFHHHILNMLDQDDSAIKNAYQLFHMLALHKFNFVFHGHQHAKQLFNINEINVHSISSLLDKNAKSNLISLYSINTTTGKLLNRDEFSFSQDEINSDGTRGRYKKSC